jgi:signal transduction histidine kinase
MEEVLVLGRFESGKTEFNPAQFDLQALCQRIGEEIQTATANRCEIQVQTDEPIKVAFGDEGLVRHILTNLLSNAVKYSPEGGQVILKVAKDGCKAVFSIIDRGCGIPAADQARLFQAFHRGGNVGQIPGTGLGLVIVKRCVELHDGDVQCKSNEGAGTTFTVALPLCPRNSETDPAI